VKFTDGGVYNVDEDMDEDMGVKTVLEGPRPGSIGALTGAMEAEADVELYEDSGTVYELKRSKKPSANNGGYEGVVKQGMLFNAKPTLKTGGGQTMLPGGGCRTAKEAAVRIAKYKLDPYPIEKVNPDRAERGQGKVRRLTRGLCPCVDVCHVPCARRNVRQRTTRTRTFSCPTACRCRCG